MGIIKALAKGIGADGPILAGLTIMSCEVKKNAGHFGAEKTKESEIILMICCFNLFYPMILRCGKNRKSSISSCSIQIAVFVVTYSL